MVSDERYQSRISQENSCRSEISDNVAKIMVFGAYLIFGVLVWLDIACLDYFDGFPPFLRISAQKNFQVIFFLRILTAADMRNTVFLKNRSKDFLAFLHEGSVR